MPGGQTGQWLGPVLAGRRAPVHVGPEQPQGRPRPTRRSSRSPSSGTSSTRTAPSRTTPTSTTPGTRASRRASTRAGSPRPGGRSSCRTTRKSSKGKWRAQQLPQWNAGENVSGNWGGSTLAVLKDDQEQGRGGGVRALDPRRSSSRSRCSRYRAVPVPAAELDAQQPEVAGPEVPVLRRPGGQQGLRPDGERRGQGLGVAADPRVRRHARATPSRASPSTRARAPRRPCSRGRTRSSTTPSSKA